MSKRMTWGSALLILVIAASSRAASTTSGTVTEKGTTLKVVDAFAWEEPEHEWTPDKKVIHVWLADHPLDHKALVAAKDLRAEMKRQPNKGAVVVELEFSSTGQWQGGEYNVPNSLCGLGCMEGAAKKATTKLAADTLAGAIHSKAVDYADQMGPTVDLTLDIKVEKRLATPAGQAVQ